MKRYKSWEIPKKLTEEEIKAINENNKEFLSKSQDIIVTEIIEKTDYDKDGSKITKYEQKKHNISKKINESAKLLKIDNAKKLEELLYGLSQEEN